MGRALIEAKCAIAGPFMTETHILRCIKTHLQLPGELAKREVLDEHRGAGLIADDPHAQGCAARQAERDHAAYQQRCACPAAARRLR